MNIVASSSNAPPFKSPGDIVRKDAGVNGDFEQQHIVAYWDGLQAQVSALRGLQEALPRELESPLPSVSDRAFRGEL